MSGAARAARAVAHIARAETLERVRRPSFLIVLGVAVWFAYVSMPANSARYVTMQIAGTRGVYNSAWVGMLAALMSATFLALVGFYLVHRAVDRDRVTGVGEILATAPLSRAEYLFGKAVSNFTVLAAIALVVATAAGAMQLVRGEDRTLDLAALYAPTLPALAVIAAAAVLFECVRPLRGGGGNVVWFFACTLVLLPGVASMQRGARLDDLIGAGLVIPDAIAAHDAAFPDSAGAHGFSIGFQFHDAAVRLRTFRWRGPRWSVGAAAARLLWFAVAAGIVFVAAVPFDRFDPAGFQGGFHKSPSARRRERRAFQKSPIAALSGAARPAEYLTIRLGRAAPSALHSAISGEPVTDGLHGATPAPRARWGGMFSLTAAEARLLVAGRSRWWWLVMLGLGVAQALAPLPVARAWLLPFAWVWPLLAWSALGAREVRHGTAPLVLSAPHPVARPLVAAALAGVALAALAGAPVVLREALAGDAAGVAAWLTGACFVPALALALGTWTGGATAFEVAYVALWYVGPMNHVAALDYLGFSQTSAAAGAWAGFAVAATALLGLAAAGRSWRLARG